MDDFIRRAEKALDRDREASKKNQYKTYAMYAGLGVLGVAAVGAAIVLGPRLVSAIPKPRFLMTNDELVENFMLLEPGLTRAEVVGLLGEPATKDAKGTKSTMIAILADPGNSCSLSSPPMFPGKPPPISNGVRDEWVYGPYHGKINGQKSLGGTIVLLVAFQGNVLVEATKLNVLSSIQDSTGPKR